MPDTQLIPEIEFFWHRISLNTTEANVKAGANAPHGRKLTQHMQELGRTCSSLLKHSFSYFSRNSLFDASFFLSILCNWSHVGREFLPSFSASEGLKSDSHARSRKRDTATCVVARGTTLHAFTTNDQQKGHEGKQTP